MTSERSPPDIQLIRCDPGFLHIHLFDPNVLGLPASSSQPAPNALRFEAQPDPPEASLRGILPPAVLEEAFPICVMRATALDPALGLSRGPIGLFRLPFLHFHPLNRCFAPISSVSPL